ncbi:CLUMA_CG016250, isoform A, partial [Clunio marinus]
KKRLKVNSVTCPSIEKEGNWDRKVQSSPAKGYRRLSGYALDDKQSDPSTYRQSKSLEDVGNKVKVNSSNHLFLINDVDEDETNMNKSKRDLIESDAFGPIVNQNTLPGTPMVDSLSEISKSFGSGISINIHNDRRPSVSGSFDESFHSITSSKFLLLQRFTEIESMHPNALERKFSYKKRKKFTENDVIKEVSPDSGHGDDISLVLSPNDGFDGNSNSAERRPSKQDPELREDPDSLFFRDGRRKIDMVLCYGEEFDGVMTEIDARRREQRKCFQENLTKEGLDIEIEDKSQAFDEKTFFVKIHLPWRTESRYAEVMNLKLPIRRFHTISVKNSDNESNVIAKNKNIQTMYRFLKKMWNYFITITEYDYTLIEKEPSFYSATAGGKREEQFIVKDRMTHYNSAQRSLIVFQILLRAKYDDGEKCGIRRLLNDGTYQSCFPLHEGRHDKSHSSGTVFDRRLLYLEWANPFKTWYKRQPLCLVRKYFGDKIALYFCWLGFYTQMLVFPAIVGFLCFIYGLASMNSDDNTPSKEMCNPYGIGNITLCPLCDKACSYQKLHDSCFFAQLTYLFDNPATVFFAIFMSLWATTFLELWKRKQSMVAWEWDLHNVENDEEPRPEFETSVKTFRINPVTREKEAYMPYWHKFFRLMATGSVVLFMICIVLGAVLGTIIYRISLVSVIYGGFGYYLKGHAKLFTSMTAALINLIIIMLLTKVYHRLAIYLTTIENPRTQTEYEDSYTFKIFVFEFMNYYSSLIYIAFFKGRFYDYPGDDGARKNEFFKLKGDICDPAGCLSELCIQLSIIMIGKQFFNNFMEYLYPAFYNWWRQRKHKKETKDQSHRHTSWEQDYHLQDPGRLALFDEYLEMIIQYGFVTLFVAAFPLAPLFALLNNIAEVRLDAYKMVSQARRPLAERVEDIGAWFGILKIITYVAVVSNAFVIAYTSDFIPRMVYKYVYSQRNDLTGYIYHSLSIFNTSDYREEWGAKNENDPETCFYRGYRQPYNSSEQYDLSPVYWHVFAARLAFVVVFEHLVFVITAVMQFLIPDIPRELKTQMQREQLLAKEAKYQNGIAKAQEYEDLLTAIRDNNGSNKIAKGNNDVHVDKFLRFAITRCFWGRISRGVSRDERTDSKPRTPLDAFGRVMSYKKMSRHSTVKDTTQLRVDDPSKPIKIFRNPNDRTASVEPITVPALMKRTVENYGNHTALMHKDESSKKWKGITYKELRDRVEKMAKVFIKLGLKRHGTVAVLAFNSVEWFVSELAAIHAGGQIAGVYTTNSVDSCLHVLESSRANIVIVDDPKQMEKIHAIKDQLKDLKAVVQTLSPYAEYIKNEDGYWRWSEIENLNTDNVEEEYQNRLSSIAANECCCLVYTSGTVGKPKGVMLSHDNFTWDAYALSAHVSNLQMGREVLVSYLPLSHVAAQIMDIFMMLTVAGTVYFADKDALKGSLVKTLLEARPTNFMAVPRVYEKLHEKLAQISTESNTIKRMIGSWARNVTLEHHLTRMSGRSSNSIQYKLAKTMFTSKVKKALGLDRAKNFITGAAPLSRETKEFFLSLDIHIVEAFGMSETTGGHTMSSVDQSSFETIGRQIPGVQTKIINEGEDGKGEICIRGRHVFMGYINDMEKTIETIDDDRWLRTGDTGYIDRDGYVFITGRIKELIITAGGENIPPILIENAVKQQCPAISNAFLVGDKRKFLTVLLTLRTLVDGEGIPCDELAPETIKWLEGISCGKKYKKLSEILAAGPDVTVNKELQNAVDCANKKAISNAQKVQKFAILPCDFSIPTGEFGPTMKLKRNVVVENRMKETTEFRVTEKSKPVRILRDPNDRPSSVAPITVPALMKRTVDNYGSHTALMYKDEVTKAWKGITYKEYRDRVEKIAKVFIKLGLERHGVVAVLAFNSVEWFVSELAAIHAGGIIAGVYTTNSTESVHHILESSKANIVVVDDAKQMEKIHAIKDKLPHLKAVIQTLSPYAPYVKRDDGYYRWSELEAIKTETVEEEYQRRQAEIVANECCSLIYTSGTVGKPKGVMLSHDNLTWDAYSVTVRLNELQMGKEVLVSYLPLSHVAGQMVDVYIPLTLAGTIYFADRDALKGSLVKTLVEAQPTLFMGVPRVFEKMQEKMLAVGAQSGALKRLIGSWAKSVTLNHHLDRMAGRPSNSIQYKIATKLVMSKVKFALGFSRIKFMVTGAAPMSVDTKKYFLSLDMPILDVYGMSETSGGHSLSSFDSPAFETSGKSLPGIKSKIINKDENGHGEICIKGRHVFMGYLNELEKTMETLDDEGWLRTGDIGYIDNDGYIFITGRIKELIITAGGENIPPVLIENLVKSECPAISNAFLVGDKRKFLTMLVTLKTEMDSEGAPKDELAGETLKWLEGLEVKHKTLSEVLAAGPDPKVLHAIQEAINRANKSSVSNAQKVQKFAILPHDFSIPTGELGPTMKLKRNIVADMYKDSMIKMNDSLKVSNDIKNIRVTDPTKTVTILNDSNDRSSSVAPITVPALMKRTVDNYGSHTALMYKDEVTKAWKGITYKEYRDRVEKIAKVFIKLGLERHGVVAVLAFNSLEWFVSELAAIHAGGIIAGIYSTNSSDACLHILETSKANIVVVDDAIQLEKIRQIKDKLPHLKAVVNILSSSLDDLKESEGYWSWKEIEILDTNDVEQEYQRRSSQIVPNECCCLIYTSGTVGMPKGVMLSHDNLTYEAFTLMTRFECQKGRERVISYLPLSHIAGQMLDVFLPMMFAGTTYFADKNALKGSIFRYIYKVKPTLFFGVPRIFEKLQEMMINNEAQSGALKRAIYSWAKRVTLEHNLNQMAGRPTASILSKFIEMLITNKVKNDLGLGECRYMFTGAAPMSVETKKYFLSMNMKIYDAFGMSESSGAHCICPEDFNSFETVGSELFGFKTKTIDQDENGHGEICIKGRHVFMGYLNELEKTMETLDDEGWLRTGDIGYIDNDGYIFITGRIKELIITAGGENIPPVLIENLVKSECPAISNAFLVGDKRKFLTMLVTLKTEMDSEGAPKDELAGETLKWLEGLEVKHKTLSEVLAAGPDPKVLHAIQEAINRANKSSVSNAQKVQKFAILPHDFSIPTGELGPTMKLKRNIVAGMYKDVIEKLYENN